MHDSGGGGGGSTGTYWYGISVETMWQWVNRDLTPHYNQSTSWKKTSELCGLYQQRLQAFRDRLAQSWNPDTSKASETFLTKIDELIKSVQDVDKVAGLNYQAAVDIPNAISEAKYKLQPIYERWKAAETPEDQTTAQREAAGVMYGLSSDLSTSRVKLGPPQPYVAPVPKRDTGGDYGDGSVPPPVIPPVVPTPPPTIPSPPTGPMSPMPSPKGPDLTGLNPPNPGPFPPPTTPPGPGPHIPPPGNPGPIPPPGGPVIRPPGLPGPGVPGRPGPGLPGVPPPGAPRGPLGPITGGPGGTPVRPPTTGIIGGGGTPPPGGGRGVGGVRTNPVGGMIGSPATGRGAAGAGAGGRGSAGAAGAMGIGGRPGQRSDGEADHLDPDTEWDVAQGVAPVLDTPEKQGPIDPGPAIGLSR